RDALRARGRNHGVLARDPALATALQKRRDLFFDRGGAQYPCFAHANQARGGRGAQEARFDADRPKLLGRPAVGAGARLRHRVIESGSSKCSSSPSSSTVSGGWADSPSPSASSSAYSPICWYTRSMAVVNAA